MHEDELIVSSSVSDIFRVSSISTSTPSMPASTSVPLAIITGASGGLGLGIANLLAKRGMRTILIARSQDKLQAHAQELSQYTPSVPVTLDLSDTAAIAPVMSELIATHGPADVLVNNAGFGIYKPLLEHTAAERDELMRVNFTASMEMTCAVLPGMLQRRRGHLINIASIAAKFGPWGHGVYSASKAALIAMTQSLAVEHQESGVHFSYVNPGLIDTDFFDDPRYRRLFERMRSRALSPEYAARQIVALLDRPRLELCIPKRYRFMDAITAISPAFTRRIVSSQSIPPTRS